jgi:L-amino acid N-acyltransferase
MLLIRKATIDDVSAIREIYNEAILNTTATFDTEIKTLENRQEWFRNRDENFPVIVAEKSGEVVGFAAFNKWSERKAYDITAENSLYINPKFRNQGIGKRMLEVLVGIGKETNIVSIIARISEGNEQSIYLHELNGFVKIGVMKKVGMKFGKLLDVTLMQKIYDR